MVAHLHLTSRLEFGAMRIVLIYIMCGGGRGKKKERGRQEVLWWHTAYYFILKKLNLKTVFNQLFYSIKKFTSNDILKLCCS